MVESTVSGHQFACVRERKEDKKEIIWFDPLVRKSVVYTEIQKMKGLPRCKYTENRNLELEKIQPADPFDP